MQQVGICCLMQGHPRSHHSLDVGLLLPTLCDPMECSLSGSSICGIFQARVLEWIAIYFSRGSIWPRNWTWVFCIAGRRFTIWATTETVCSESNIKYLWSTCWVVSPDFSSNYFLDYNLHISQAKSLGSLLNWKFLHPIFIVMDTGKLELSS